MILVTQKGGPKEDVLCGRDSIKTSPTPVKTLDRLPFN